MKGLPGSTAKIQIACFLLGITIALFLQISPARAEDIDASQSFEFVNLLQGQTASNLTTTQSTPFGFHTVIVTSIGNKTLRASIGAIDSTTLGWWFISLFGTGGKDFADFSFGLLPYGGPAAQIDIGSGFSIAIATVNLFITNKTAADLAADPAGYSVTVGP